ncbi:MAG: glycosyl transferase [Hyphomicrobiales bacterium]|nr:MAG: glycosyl transferase [Hyphomicrobiales bacterium]
MISVLTLVKNREAHLGNLVEGLRRSSTAPTELVIIDMSDQPVERPAADFPITLVRLDTDALPLARARNLAAAHAGTDRLLFLDVDCIPGADLVSAMTNSLGGGDALICAEVLYLSAHDAKNGCWSEHSLRASGMPHPVRSFPAAGRARETNYGLFWSLAFGVSRGAFDRAGGFDENFSGYGAEDTDFAFRAQKAGLDLFFLGGASAYHQHHGVVDPPLQHFADIIRNARRFYAKWNVWPMKGWLDAFADMGLVTWASGDLVVKRTPTRADIGKARQPRDRRF